MGRHGLNPTNMSNQLIPVSDAVIVRQENISTIVQAGPQSYQTNLLSCQRCNEAGQQLLDEIERCGMSDDLDRRLAEYIVKVRKTVTKMNERRSPVTKLFDQVRSEFTILENSIDPTKKDTCLLYTSPSPRDLSTSRMPSSA